jgi:hypothetical protein
MISDMATEETAIAAEESLAPAPRKEKGKEKEIAEDTLEEEDFNFQNTLGQKLSKAKKEELKDYMQYHAVINQEHCSSVALTRRA